MMGLKVSDLLVSVNGADASGLTNDEAYAEIVKGEDCFEMIIER